MRFLVDVCVDVGVREWLYGEGHDAIHLRDEGLQKLPNGRIFVRADEERRIIVTIDLDFGEILSLSGDRIVSTIVFRLRDTRPQSLISRLRAILPEIEPDLAQGAIVIVEPARCRVRRLPFR